MLVLLVLENTPVWVWVLLAFLIYRGIVALNPRAVDPRRALVLPIVFLVWAIVDFVVSQRRDRAMHVVYPAGSLVGDVIAVATGVAVWVAIAFWLHELLIGVNPLA